ncbi:endolytic transglycosylase MltG [Spirochaeta cellobiosiphila]|uniref:endolytic transglycosylase MltG n=1 Tax=Spirochaeta cellobiosiphila TaxID=504483 RepID=UPI000490D782|nr:endolytic transglycosylase MltG [Spirochaeta cellobiosiphila]
MKKILYAIISVIIVLILLLLVTIGVGVYWNTPTRISDEDFVYIIYGGESFSSVAQDLEDRNLIKNQYLFRILGKVLNSENKLRSGAFKLSPKLSTWDNYQILINGPQEMVQITIPEGWTINKIGKLLERKGITDYIDFKTAVSDPVLLSELGIIDKTAEGYLFPDTYKFVPGQDAESVVKFLVNEFYSKISSIYPDWKNLSQDELNKRLILASVIEREFRTPSEAPKIASVFYNRLENGIALESCATIEYVLTEIEGKPHPERIFYRDLEIDNPYNTYKYKGLPPGPISNPGLVSLKAAFYPEETNYLFFVIEDPSEGRHRFSETYDQHLRAKSLYLKKL